MANTVSQLKAYFSTEDKPVTMKEMTDFWKSCSEEDKEFFKDAEIS